MERNQALTVAVSFAVVFIEEVARETKEGVPGAANEAIAQLSKALQDVPSAPSKDDPMCRCHHTDFWHAGLQLRSYCTADRCDCQKFHEVPR